jgi:hypothetical protein
MIEFLLIKLQLLELTLTVQSTNLIIINQVLSEQKQTLEPLKGGSAAAVGKARKALATALKSGLRNLDFIIRT